jgi:hypothetical protein
VSFRADIRDYRTRGGWLWFDTVIVLEGHAVLVGLQNAYMMIDVVSVPKTSSDPCY